MRFSIFHVASASSPSAALWSLWSSLIRLYLGNQPKGISASHWSHPIYGRAVGEDVTPTGHGLPTVIQHILILALQKLKQQSMPADRGMTWCSTPGSASELVLEADIRCWPRELWRLLIKPGRLNSLVGSLLSLSSWCRSLPDIWRAEWWVPCLKVGSWRQVLQVSQTLSTYPEEPWANHSA